MVMEENTKNITDKGQTDRDILQCKADILQAWKSSTPDPAIDISEIPPKSKPPKKTEPLRPVVEKQQQQETISKPEDSRENLEKLQAEKIEETLQTEADQDDSSGIPRFNLADQILSAQRKAASTRRQGPAGNGNNGRANIAPAEGTIGRIITESKKTAPAEPIELYQSTESPEQAFDQTPAPDEPIELYEAIEQDESYFSMDADSLNPAAVQIISEIVADDLERLCGKYTVAG